MYCKTKSDDKYFIQNQNPIIQEIIFLKNLDHPNIAKLVKINDFEFCMPKYKIPKSYDVKKFIYQILSALDYLHSKGILHSDVKLENILEDDNGNYILIDYDLSEFYSFQKKLFRYTTSMEVQPPGLYLNNNLNVDVFSLGICIVYIVCNFDYTNDTQYLLEKINEKIYKDKIKSILNENGYKLLKSMLGLNGRYISANEALNHIFFNEKVPLINQNFNKIIPFISVKWNKTIFTHEMYNNILKKVLKNSKNVNYMSFLGFIQIFRKLLNTNIEQNISKFELYAIVCYFIGILIYEERESEYQSYNYPLKLLNNNYSEDEFEKCILLVLNSINWDVEMIPYNYYIENDKLTQVVFTYTIAFGNNEDLNLRQLSGNCLILSENFSPFIREEYNDWIYDEELSVLKNVYRRRMHD